MKFKLFGSGKGKEEKKPKSKAAASQIADLEEQLSDWTDDLKKTEESIQKRPEKVSETPESDVAPARPHGPMKELSLEAEGDGLDDGGLVTDEDLEKINVIEVQKEAEPTPEVKAEKSGSVEDSFKQLFVNEDDEDNPLANLIQSLPEVTINELEDDLKEIKDIIKDWQRK